MKDVIPKANHMQRNREKRRYDKPRVRESYMMLKKSSEKVKKGFLSKIK